MRIYLVQPGENETGNLTEKGKWQLHTLARRLINEKIEVDRVYVNGHNISRQCGEIISKSLRVPIISDERFTEIDKLVIIGELNESHLENIENINLFIDELANKSKDVIITIGGGIHRMIISRLTGMQLSETRHFLFKSSGVSILEYSNDNGTGKWRILSLNDLTHLSVP